jgi:lipopolysaccharide assembly protein A
MSAIVIFLLILAALLVIFTLQNTLAITIHLFFWKIEDVPLVLLILSCILLGYLLALLYFYPKLWRSRRDLRKLVRKNEELQKNKDNSGSEKSVSKPDHEGIELDADDEDFSFFKD